MEAYQTNKQIKDNVASSSTTLLCDSPEHFSLVVLNHECSKLGEHITMCEPLS